MLNPNEAPEGYEAVEVPITGSCEGCVIAHGHRLCRTSACDAYERADGRTVIFKLKQPQPDLTNAATHATSYLEKYTWTCLRCNGQYTNPDHQPIPAIKLCDCCKDRVLTEYCEGK